MRNITHCVWNYTLCVKLKTVCKITHCVQITPRGFSSSPRTAHTWPPPPPIWGWFNIYFSHDPTYFKTRLKQIMLKIFVVTLFRNLFLGHFWPAWCDAPSETEWVAQVDDHWRAEVGNGDCQGSSRKEDPPSLSCPDFVFVNWSGHVTSSSLLKCLRFALWGCFICCLCLF